VSEALTRAHLASMVGARVEVLVEGPSRPGAGTRVGRTRRNEIVHLPGAPGLEPGAVVVVDVARANKHSLEGRLDSIKRPAPPRLAQTHRRIALPVVQA
jgi:tRNA A37 methylthiotransferase MiaB